jgi:hypothetical protein
MMNLELHTLHSLKKRIISKKPKINSKKNNESPDQLRKELTFDKNIEFSFPITFCQFFNHLNFIKMSLPTS